MIVFSCTFTDDDAVHWAIFVRSISKVGALSVKLRLKTGYFVAKGGGRYTGMVPLISANAKSSCGSSPEIIGAIGSVFLTTSLSASSSPAMADFGADDCNTGDRGKSGNPS